MYLSHSSGFGVRPLIYIPRWLAIAKLGRYASFSASLPGNEREHKTAGEEMKKEQKSYNESRKKRNKSQSRAGRATGGGKGYHFNEKKKHHA